MIEKEIIIPELNNETIESMIYIIRGQKVMLDFELAKIYGYSTRDFNNQIKNNIERFDVDFRFQLTKLSGTIFWGVKFPPQTICLKEDIFLTRSLNKVSIC